MRIFPILLTLIVGSLLYVFVMEREWLYTQIGISPATTPVEVVEAEVDDAEETGVTTDGLIKVVAQRSVAKVIESGIVLRGQTEALRQVDVMSETSSTVTSEPLRKGQFIEAGQEMCVLDAGTRGAQLAEAKARLSEAQSRKAEAEARVPEFSARVAEAQARLEEALTNENVADKLSEGGFAADTRVKNARASVAAARASLEAANAGLSSAQSGIDSAQAGIESAEAGVAAADKEIERLTISAPFAGLLESDTAELGALLQPGALCGTIIQLNPIKIVAFVPETEVNRVKLGARAGARLAGNDGMTVQGEVQFLSRSADPTTRTFRIEIEVDNEDLAIRDGQTAEILIETAGESAHLLPASALTLNDEGTLGVRIVDDAGLVDFMAVTLLRDTPNGVYLGGLPDDVNVIVVGQEYVTEGVTVAPTFQERKS